MLTSFVIKELRTTRSNRVRTVPRECYLRDDVGCGSLTCSDCQYHGDKHPTLRDASSAGCKPVYVLCEENVFRTQLDVLSNPSFLEKHSIVILSSMLSEMRHSKFRDFKRINAELLDLESADFVQSGMGTEAPVFVFANSQQRFCATATGARRKGQALAAFKRRQLLAAAAWYSRHLPSVKLTVLFNEDATVKGLRQSLASNSLLAALMEAVTFDCVHAYVKRVVPNLSDALSYVAADSTEGSSQWAVRFKPHWSRSKMEAAISDGTVYKGKLKVVRCSGPHALATVRVAALDGKPIQVKGLSAMNRAIHEDVVCVTGSGQVVGVLQKNWREYCGSLDERYADGKERGSVLFVPLDSRVPKIRMESRAIADLMDKRISVRIDDWPLSSRYPSGHLVSCIGTIGDLDTETKALLIEHNIPNDIDNDKWSDAVLKCLPTDVLNGQIDADSVLRTQPFRVDLRKLLVVSIDPPNCQDIDDALSCVELSNGNLEVGVHIADVAHYVAFDNALDKEAQRRSTSVYLVDRRLDMLPSLLSTDLCSLKPKTDRLAFSVLWQMEADSGRIVDTKFVRSVIHNKCKLAYSQAQCRVDAAYDHGTDAKVYGGTGDQRLDTAIDRALRALMRVAQAMRRRRFEAGSLELSSPEPKFGIDFATKLPTKLKPYPHCAANELIEEFMLCANISVAKQIVGKYPAFAALRRHPSPTAAMLEPLVKSARLILGKGSEFRCENSKELSESLKQCAVKAPVIRMIATRCMTQAVYFASGEVEAGEYLHYGLASAIYTHFTSPIRRYNDILVHRMLAASIGIAPLPLPYQSDKNLLKNICDNMNIRHRTAQYIQRASNHLYTMLFFEHKGECNAEAVITKVDAASVAVFIEDYCMQTRIQLAKAKDKHSSAWHFDAETMTLEKKSPPAFKLRPFERVSVRIRVHTSKLKRKRLHVELLDANVPVAAEARLECDDIFADDLTEASRNV